MSRREPGGDADPAGGDPARVGDEFYEELRQAGRVLLRDGALIFRWSRSPDAVPQIETRLAPRSELPGAFAAWEHP